MDLALQSYEERSCHCGGMCSGKLGRRLDLVEAKVLSHWHEFLLYKSDAQRKFEDLFARKRPKPSELDRRLEKLQESHAESLDLKLAEVRSSCNEVRIDLERHWSRQAQEVQNMQGRTEQRMEQRLEQRGDQLQHLVAGQVSELRREVRREASETWQSQEQRLRQGQDELLRFAETATQQSVKSAMMEMHSSVLAAESRAEHQMGRLRSELEQAELAAQDACARNATEITRAVSASESALKPRLQQAHAEARAAVTCLEISVEKRMQCWASEAAEEGRQAQRERLDELQEAVVQLELLLQKQGAQVAEQSQSSEARDVSFERRFKNQSQQCEELERSLSQLRREVAERTDVIESRMIAEVSGCKDELQERLGKSSRQEAVVSREVKEAQAAAASALREACEGKNAQQELQDTLNEAQERLTFLSAGLTSIQDAIASFTRELTGMKDSQKFLQQSLSSVQSSEVFEGKAFRQKLLEEMSQGWQVGLRSLGQRLSSVESACAVTDRSAATVKAEAAQLRLEMDELTQRRSAQAMQGERVEAEFSHRLHQLERAKSQQVDGIVQKLGNLTQQVETMRTSGTSGSGEGLFVELKTTIMRVEDLQAQVNRLARESKKSSEKMEGALSRLQETERSMERVAKARESSELWREVRELRSQLSDVRLQSLVRSPRSCEITQRLGWLEP